MRTDRRAEMEQIILDCLSARAAEYLRQDSPGWLEQMARALTARLDRRGSREALEKILFPHRILQVPTLQENWLLDKVMAWQRGERETPPTWCDHLAWRDEPGWPQGWYQTAVDPVALVVRIGTQWNFCPICGARRPRSSEQT